jgi:hypothetical protein
MELGNYPRYAAVFLCGLILFLLGFLAFMTWITALVSLVAIVLLTVSMSYKNKTPLGGFFLGVFASTSFLLGYLFLLCVSELSSRTFSGLNLGFEFLMEVFGVGEFGRLPSIISAVLAIASIGLFFGLLGYVFEHISLQVSVIQPRLFRDYWSNIHFLGKSDKREFSSLDRKLSSWSMRKAEWWKGLLAKITEPQPDLIFSQHEKKANSGFSRGDLFDLASGRMIGQNLISPSDLASKFKPMVLKIAETKVNPKGLRRLTFEKLLARFLERFIFSRLIWIFYLLLSISMVSSVYLIDLERNLTGIALLYSEVISAAVASLASAVTLLFVWQWQKSSKELFERRPDERILIFLVYIVLALLYLFFLSHFEPANVLYFRRARVCISQRMDRILVYMDLVVSVFFYLNRFGIYFYPSRVRSS